MKQETIDMIQNAGLVILTIEQVNEFCELRRTHKRYVIAIECLRALHNFIQCDVPGLDSTEKDAVFQQLLRKTKELIDLADAHRKG